MARSSCFILTVDADGLFQEMIESGFGIFKPDWTILKAENPKTARGMLRRYRVEAVLTELDFPVNGSGAKGPSAAGFLEELARSFPRLPLFVLTATPVDEVPSLATADFIAKPPDMDYLIGKVNRAIQHNRGSVVRGIALESLLQMLEQERKTCTLIVSSDNRVGRIYLRGGTLIHAESRGSAGKKAVFTLLSWPGSSIEILDECHAVPSISEGLSAILLEWCVQRDHGLL